MSKSGIIRPDGFGAQAEPVTIQLHTGEGALQFPFPSDDSAEIAKACQVRVNTPVGPALQFALTPQAALVLLETSKALKERDATIEKLVQRVEALEQAQGGDSAQTAEGDDIAEAHAEGYDG